MSYRNNRDPGVLRPSEITTRAAYEGRRDLLKWLGAGTAAQHWRLGPAAKRWPTPRPGKLAPLPAVQSAVPGADTFEKLTSYADITSHNNFYEFATDKGDPEQNARTLKTRPWMVSVEGLVKKPKVFDIEQLLKLSPMEDRIYRLRCVEGWSTVIPWVGYSL